ncbi:hypothetical protein ACYSNW_10850 [Enterococcus sp. LJL99]
MNHSYKSCLFVFSLYYALLAFSLPLVYAVTYHVSFMDVYTIDWLLFVLIFYPSVFLISAVRYGYHRIKFTNQYHK